MNDVITGKNRTDKTMAPAAPAVAQKGAFRVGGFFGNAISYSYGALKFVDIVARIATAAAVYLKLDSAVLHYGAAFLGATAVWEIGVAIIKANRK